MPIYIGDYLADTTHLTTEQHGAYLLLLFAYWRRRGPLPDEDDELSRRAGLMRDAWQRMRPTLAKFFEVRDGHWRHKRVELELQKAEDNKASRVSAASKAASVRWAKEKKGGTQPPTGQTTDASSMRDALRDACPSPSPSPEDTHTHPRAREGANAQGGEILSVEQVKSAVMTTGIPDGFVEMVYKAWVRRQGRDGANIPVEIVRYVRDRWGGNEGVEWRSGTHRYQPKGSSGTNRKDSRQGHNRNQDTRNNPDRYSAENLRKLPNYHGSDKVRDQKPEPPSTT